MYKAYYNNQGPPKCRISMQATQNLRICENMYVYLCGVKSITGKTSEDIYTTLLFNPPG